MNEEILRIGKDGSLVGILSEPASPSASGPVFLILNAGLVHRVGPHRLHTHLARHLAGAGFTALRFDVSGLGDSQVRRDGLPYHRSRFSEARDAMDHLQSARGADEFVLLGLCSGADHAFRMAGLDPRVTGVVMLNGYEYRRAAFYFHYCRTQMLGFESWWNVVRGTHPLWSKLRERVAVSFPGRDERGVAQRFVMHIPPRKEAESKLRALVQRGVHLLFVYCGNYGRFYSRARGVTGKFPPADRNGQVRVACLPESNHTFGLLSHQAWLFAAVCDWARTTWPAKT